jgi:hypothetical protein
MIVSPLVAAASHGSEKILEPSGRCGDSSTGEADLRVGTRGADICTEAAMVGRTAQMLYGCGGAGRDVELQRS